MTILDLFETLTRDDIDQFVHEGREENLHFEFKITKGASLKSEDDKRNLARAISGFANSGGGLVIWGIDGRKGTDGIDRAQRVVPIDPVKQFVARLNELTGESVSPAVPGVQHRAVPLDGTSGVAVTYVPESDFGPHMAKAGDDRYYKRSGDSFYRMEHYDLADMFGRRAHPVLRVGFEWNVVLDGGSTPTRATATLIVRFIMANDGRGVARYPALTIGNPQNWTPSDYREQYILEGNMLTIAPAPKGWWLRYAGGADVVMYPGDRFQAAWVHFHFSPNRTNMPELVIPAYVVGAETQPFQNTLIIHGDEIRSATAAAFEKKGWSISK